MVDRVVSRRRADDRGVLLQSARRRAARPGRSAAEDVRSMSRKKVSGFPCEKREAQARRSCSRNTRHDRAAAARRQRSHRGIRHTARHREGGAACQYRRRQGRDARHCRRIRFRQIGHFLRGHAHSRPRRQDRRRLGCLLRHRREGCDGRRDARSARPRNVDDLPEPAAGAQSDPQGRPPDRGRAAAACPGRPRRGGANGRSRRWSR